MSLGVKGVDAEEGGCGRVGRGHPRATEMFGVEMARAAPALDPSFSSESGSVPCLNSCRPAHCRRQIHPRGQPVCKTCRNKEALPVAYLAGGGGVLWRWLGRVASLHAQKLLSSFSDRVGAKWLLVNFVSFSSDMKVFKAAVSAAPGPSSGLFRSSEPARAQMNTNPHNDSRVVAG